ncbi:RING finger protein 122 isoform X1 [Heliangelus exortis]|uniref:RING finger protein 122 isoform X1 n=1 Tax=Heliangelus exortis TaxID=472823 RepID=UPI003A942C76
MPPYPWCNGCSCSLGLIYTPKPCTMPPITFQDLPLNLYMVIFGTGIFVFVLSLIFCCYFLSKLRHRAQSERFGYKEVVLKGDARRLNVHGVPPEVVGNSLRLPHVQQNHGGPGPAPPRDRNHPG